VTWAGCPRIARWCCWTCAVGLEITDPDRRQVAERRRGEAWFPDAYAALQRIWSGDATAADWTAIAPFTYGRWDAVAQAHLAQEASQTNADAAAAYYSAGALDPEATSASLARLRAPVLLVAGEYDVALPPSAPPSMPACSLRPNWPYSRAAATIPGSTIRSGWCRPWRGSCPDRSAQGAQVPKADDRTGQADHGLVGVGAAFVAGAEPSEGMEPGEGALWS
jgi:hypothetical protein